MEKNDEPTSNKQHEKNDETGLQQMAVNPNPAANANIKDNLQSESKEEIEQAENGVGSEITDGEGG